MKPLPIALAGIASIFLLTGCEEDTADTGNSTENDTQVVETQSTIDEQRLLSLSFTITATGGNDDPSDDRQLEVSALAYCEKLDELPMDEYTSQCGEHVQGILEYYAEDRECFEGTFPAINSDVRNHDNMPRNENGFCYDVYPDNYAFWTEDMLRRAIDRPTDDNFYTVTGIKPL